MIEHEIYNGVLSGMGLGGDTFWYRNPLRRSVDHVVQGHNDLAEREAPGRRRICCPTNILRTLAQWQTYACTADADGVWVHQYGACTARISLPGGGSLAFEEETEYPWDGAVSLIVTGCPERPVSVRLRIPAWADGATLTVNGESVKPAPAAGTYATLARIWAPGDRIGLRLPMRARLIEAHPLVEHCRNQVAVMRGPILYCLESVDLPGSMCLEGISLPADVQLEPEPMADLPGGLLALRGNALHRPQADWQGTLYRPVGPGRLGGTPIRLIPYFAWANRGPSAMSVWLPVVWR
jgi:DUF1680 family protein